MTLNLLTAVPEGMVLLADSMSTLNSATTTGVVTTNFPNAEKLIELGSNLPAAAMISGLGILGTDVVGVIIKRASRALDNGQFSHDAAGVETAVADTVDPIYTAAVNQFKADMAASWSVPGRIDEVNKARVARGLPAITSVDPDRVKVLDDPNGPQDPADWDVWGEFALTVVVASFFVDARAVAIDWPGRRISVHVPGPYPLTWWGSGGSIVSRVVRGFDMGILTRLSAQGDAEAQSTLAIANSRSEFPMPTPIAAMPLQDAVEFTEFLGQVSSGYERFTAGPPSVGGPLDVMVLQHQRREWIRQKRIHSSII